MNHKEAERKMQGKGAPPRSFEGPYRPSWIDMFNHWVDGLPVNLWVFHFLLAILLILVHALFLWLEDSLLTGEIFPIIIFNSLAVPYLLLLIFLLDRQASIALNNHASGPCYVAGRSRWQRLQAIHHALPRATGSWDIGHGIHNPAPQCDDLAFPVCSSKSTANFFNRFSHP